MQELNPDIKLSTRLERGSPENQFSEKKFVDYSYFNLGFDLNTNEVAIFWKLFYKLLSFYYIWDFFPAKSLYCVCLEGMACKQNIKHKGRYVFP